MGKKKMTLLVLSLALVASLSFGMTFAYLTSLTERRVNNFSFQTESLNAKLTEPDWDGVKYYDPADGMTPIYGLTDQGDPIYGYTDGDITKPVTDKGAIQNPNVDRPRTGNPEYGDELAQHMIPGRSAPKNPIITNTGNICDEWVSMKITFVYADGSPNAGKPLEAGDRLNLMSIINIDYKTGENDDWERVEGDENSVSQVFHYKDILTKASSGNNYAEGGKTDPLFTKVSVKPEATPVQIDAIKDIGGFAIFIEGFAAQSDVAVDYSGYKAWAIDGAIFTNTPTDTDAADVSKPGIIPANQMLTE